MSDDSKQPMADPGRRNFLEKATGVVAGAGMIAATWPFISSMNPASNTLARAETAVDLQGIAAGEAATVEWQGKPVFILRRTPEQIAAMSVSMGSQKDPQADETRVQRPEWLVVIGLCTHLGCVPTRKPEGWFCPCHGSVFDNSGRVLKGPAPRNLDLPPYEFVAVDKILIKKA